MRLFLLVACLLTLSACVTRQPTGIEWESQRDRVAGLKDWDFKGRMAVKVADDPDASGQLNVAWSQAAETSDIRLSGPFGAGAWHLLWEAERISVRDSSGDRSIEYTGPEAAEEFMRGELGWSFPADGIRYWVRGLPDPADEAVLRWTDTGALAGLRQHGWDIVYDRYGRFDNLNLPTKITIQGRGVRLRVAISKWRVAADQG